MEDKENKETENHGGMRKGSGRKKKFEEPAGMTFKTEKALKEAAKKQHGTKLNDLFNTWLNSITDIEKLTNQ